MHFRLSASFLSIYLHNLQIVFSVPFGSDALRFDSIGFPEWEILHVRVFFLFAAASC